MNTMEKIFMEEGSNEQGAKQINFSIVLSSENYNEFVNIINKSESYACFTDSGNAGSYEENIERKATDLLKKFFIPANTKGYRYLRDAVILVAEDPELIGKVTKRLYPEIARVHDTTAVRVERVIRHAIEISCKVGDMDFIASYFPLCMAGNKLKPSNAEFIAVLSDELRFCMRK